MRPPATPVEPPRELSVKDFPWRRRGVLLPVGDRRTAALGICLFTASKPHVLAVQLASFWLVRTLGTRALPGRSRGWTAPFPAEAWSRLLADWRSRVGAFDGVAIYQRRQSERDGLTLLLTRAGAGVAVLKIRASAGSLLREQQALVAIEAARPTTFRAPRALGSGSLDDGLHWSAQSAVFERPHKPVHDPSPQLFAEVGACLAAIPGTDPGASLAHNDLTPWNLRRDHRGDVWLYDWEDWAPAPAQADRVYFHATSRALNDSPMPAGLPEAAVEHWRERLRAREHHNDADLRLHRRMVAALDERTGAENETG